MIHSHRFTRCLPGFIMVLALLLTSAAPLPVRAAESSALMLVATPCSRTERARLSYKWGAALIKTWHMVVTHP